jgi:hypothetical protein
MRHPRGKVSLRKAIETRDGEGRDLGMNDRQLCRADFS